jgi:hypothetical protein
MERVIATRNLRPRCQTLGVRAPKQILGEAEEVAHLAPGRRDI